MEGLRGLRAPLIWGARLGSASWGVSHGRWTVRLCRAWFSFVLQPRVSYPTPFLRYLIFYITDPNHKSRYPKKGVGYEPLGMAGELRLWHMGVSDLILGSL